MWTLAFLIVALVLFVLAAFPVPSGRVNLLAVGLAFFAGSFLVAKIGG